MRQPDPQSQRTPPIVVVVAGPAASGKTTLARTLAGCLHYALADLDEVTGPLVEELLSRLGEPAHALDQDLGREIRDSRYRTLAQVTRANLHVGVVVAAPCTREISTRSEWVRWCDALSPRGEEGVALIYLSSPPAVLAQRLATRGEPRDALKIRGVEESPRPAPGVAHFVVDGTGDPESETHAVLQSLGAAAREPGRLTCSS